MDSQPTDTTQPSSSGANAQRRVYMPNRACENCRSLKIRCIPCEPGVSNKCDRCYKSDKDCVHALPTRRKPRKRTDAKVAELEKEVRALSSIIRQQRDRMSPVSSPPSNEPSPDAQQSLPPAADFGTSDLNAGKSYAPSFPRYDVVGRGIVTLEKARQYLDRFLTKLLPHFPIVHFPTDYNFDELKKSRPVSLLAMIAAGASMEVDAARHLNHDLTTTIAEQIMIQGKKTMDLLQALLIATLWHYPPDSFQELKYVQYSHLAASMVSDVGFTSRIRPMGKGCLPLSQYDPNSRFNALRQSFTNPNIFLHEEVESAEFSRTLLGSYFLCAGISYKLQRPSAITFSGQIREALELLEASEDRVALDARLLALVRMQRIMEESASSLGYDDSTSTIDLGQHRIQMVLKNFDRQLQTFKKTVPEEATSRSFDFIYLVNRAQLHEIALYADHNREDFKPPYFVEKLRRVTATPIELTPAHIDAMFISLSSTQAALDLFINGDLEWTRSVPTVVIVGSMYCMLVLLKLYSSSCEPNSPIARLCDRDTIRAGHYISRLRRVLQAASEGGLCRIATKFARVAGFLEQWYLVQSGTIGAPAQYEDLLEPLQHLSATHSSSSAYTNTNTTTTSTTQNDSVEPDKDHSTPLSDTAMSHALPTPPSDASYSQTHSRSGLTPESPNNTYNDIETSKAAAAGISGPPFLPHITGQGSAFDFDMPLDFSVGLGGSLWGNSANMDRTLMNDYMMMQDPQLYDIHDLLGLNSAALENMQWDLPAVQGSVTHDNFEIAKERQARSKMEQS